MAVIRYEALTALQTAIAAAVPELVGADKIVIAWAPPEKTACMPALAIIPTRWKYLPDQECEHFMDPLTTSVVYDVGRHEATIQLRLVAATPGERMTIEQKLIDLFLSQEGRPGILVTTISAVTTPEIRDWFCSWELEGDEWRSEKAFTNQLWSVCEITATLPALVTRAGVYTIDDLRLGITADFATTFNSATFDTSEGIERVQVNQDGTYSPL